MIRRAAWLATFLAAVSLTPSTVRAFTIIYSNDVHGEIEPCGCSKLPMGGMERKYNYLQKLGKQDLLQLDGGDLLFSSPEIPEELVKQSKLQASFVIKAYNILGHDAVVPGERDFALGLETFLDLAKEAKFEFIAANLKIKNASFWSKLSWIEEHIIVTKKKKNGKKITIGVFGLVDPELNLPEELVAEAVQDAAARKVKELRPKVDLLIALTHQGLDKDKTLVNQVSGIDIIVGGHSQSFLQKRTVVNNTELFQASYQNQYIGSIQLDDKNKVSQTELTPLDAGYDTPEKDRPKLKIAFLVDNFKESIAKLNTQETSIKRTASNPKAEIHTFPQCAECHKEQFDFWRKTDHTNALMPLLKGNQLRNKECLGCHTVGLGADHGFSTVNDVALYRTPQGKEIPLPVENLAEYLQQIHQAKSLNTQVQITPSKKSRTSVDHSLSRLKKVYGSVQCENCHGFGGEHPYSDSMAGPVAQTSCLECHNSKRSASWYQNGKLIQGLLAKKIKMIACPSMDTASN